MFVVNLNPKGRTACKANGVRVEVIEDLVKQRLNGIITYPEVLQQTVALTLESMEEQKEPLKRQLLEIEEEISQI